MDAQHRTNHLLFQCLAALAVLAYAFVFGLLRDRHSAQTGAASQGIYVFSPLDSSARKYAKHLTERTSVPALSIAAASTAARLKALGIDPELVTPALLLPQGEGRIVVSNLMVIQEILSPLYGGSTPPLRGSIGALAGLAIWLIFWQWWRRAAYFGVVWPILGAFVLALAVPNCPECIGTPKFAWIPWLGVAGFLIAMLAIGTPRAKPRWMLAATCAIAVCATLLQAYALLGDPKLCALCLLATAAAAGLFFNCRLAMTETLPRFYSGSKVLSAACVSLPLLAAGGQFLGSPTEARAQDSYRSVVGRPLSQYVQGWKPKPGRQLVLVSLVGCGACDQAHEDLLREKVPYQEIPYHTVLSSGPSFKADFSRVAPLILLCDSAGKILQAEAGWSADPEEAKQLAESCKRSLGGEDAQ